VNHSLLLVLALLSLQCVHVLPISIAVWIIPADTSINRVICYIVAGLVVLISVESSRDCLLNVKRHLIVRLLLLLLLLATPIATEDN
jgi:hypothetical protein